MKPGGENFERGERERECVFMVIAHWVDQVNFIPYMQMISLIRLNDVCSDIKDDIGKLTDCIRMIQYCVFFV